MPRIWGVTMTALGVSVLLGQDLVNTQLVRPWKRIANYELVRAEPARGLGVSTLDLHADVQRCVRWPVFDYAWKEAGEFPWREEFARVGNIVNGPPLHPDDVLCF